MTIMLTDVTGSVPYFVSMYETSDKGMMIVSRLVVKQTERLNIY
jgi:hypothetical protein